MLTLETLTTEQKEFIQLGDKKDYDKELDIKILTNDCEWVEYGNQLFTVTFLHGGITYECAYVFEVGPGCYDWAHYNSDCYLKVLPPKEKPIKYHLVIESSLGAGGVRLTMKNVPDELHQRILEKYGSYWEMLEEGHVDEYEEFLSCEEIRPFEIFSGENE